MARLFIAAWPSDEAVSELRTLPRKPRRGVRFVDPDQWHITLRFLGEADPDEVGACLEALESRPRTVHLGPGVDLLAERSLVVPVTGVDDLAAEIEDRTGHLGESPRRRFRGHLTLARLTRGADPPSALGMYVDVAFDVDEVALVRSRLRPEGPIYDTLDTWRLA